ncbi:MAG: hypothetical protein COT84_01920 [Chlamydiae bacterium CG10_big_fil_rev_8_21_14_0_10_35_9]|nr:MAG: hypothetical protein COT84_01920 [Chlamydiae bacterium CG10_big_fil_rev_8_21_14_0_10_35_9]
MASFGDNKVPPPQTPVRPQVEQVESQFQAQRSIRSQKIEDRIEELEEFLLKASQVLVKPTQDTKSLKDTFSLDDTFTLLTNLRNIIQFGLLKADEEDQLISDLTTLKEQLDGGAMKVGASSEFLHQIMTHLEENDPKVKVLNLIQDFKEHLHYLPMKNLADYSHMEEKEFNELMAPIHSFLRNDLTKFQSETLAKKLEGIYIPFESSPKENLSLAIEQIKQIAADITKGSL